jgi:hypothetical protein
MKRRESLAKIAETALSPDDNELTTAATSPDEKVSPFANKALPQVDRTMAGLEPYVGPWTADQIQHLLRRTTFGPTKADIDILKTMTLNGAVDMIMAPPQPELSQPLNYITPTTSNGEIAPVGSTWVNSIYQAAGSTGAPTGLRRNSLKAWWISLILNQSLSIREKLVLFWHDHFVTEIDNVNDPRYSYRYNDLLRRYALGNIKDLAREITKDGAMLVYLNGTNNQRSGPDENYARELQELFTIGKGPLVGPGDYTNYTEADVKAAARVLTGWRRFQNPDGTVGVQTGYFDATRHDTTNKTFSPRYNSTVITGGTDGAAELSGLLDMIFAQPETARFLCRKFYRWFVYYVIDAATEANVIEPMANILRSNGYNVGPALTALFKSAHFYDPVNMGCMIKNPADFVTGVCRQFGMAPPAADVVRQYTGWYSLASQCAVLQQDIGEPPNVAGWPAYYQDPEFYELWINSDTLVRRTRLTDLMIGNGYTPATGVTFVIDPIAFVRTLVNPSDPNAVIDELAQRLFAIQITPAQKAILKTYIIQGLPDYEWTNEWNAYLADPTNVNLSRPLKSKLQALIGLMLRMPEYQLS